MPIVSAHANTIQGKNLLDICPTRWTGCTPGFLDTKVDARPAEEVPTVGVDGLHNFTVTGESTNWTKKVPLHLP